MNRGGAVGRCSRSLADELWLYIFDCVLSAEGASSSWINDDSWALSTNLSPPNQPAHTDGAMTLLRRPLPAPTMHPILILPLVCRQWRRVVFLHPIWRTLAWHRFLPNRRNKRQIKPLDTYFKILAADPRRLIPVTSIELDFARHFVKLEPSTVEFLLSSLPLPERVHTVALEVSWDVGGDHRVWKHLRKCMSLRRFLVRGNPIQSRDQLLGIDSTCLVLLSHPIITATPGSPMRKHRKSKSLSPQLSSTPSPSPSPPSLSPTFNLTHLLLEGFGSGTFSFRALLVLLRAAPNLTSLSVGYVRGTLDLTSLSHSLPSLTSLAMTFLVQRHHQRSTTLQLDHVQRSHDTSRLQVLLPATIPGSPPNMQQHRAVDVLPKVVGGLAGFSDRLKTLAIHSASKDSAIPGIVVERLLRSLTESPDGAGSNSSTDATSSSTIASNRDRDRAPVLENLHLPAQLSFSMMDNGAFATEQTLLQCIRPLKHLHTITIHDTTNKVNRSLIAQLRNLVQNVVDYWQ